MLGRLIQATATYGRGSNPLESATEESHTRNLLYGQSQQTYSFAQSPPSSPYSTPIFRPGSFDDRGGLELEEKDVRILIAQDAGVEEKPTLLFDSRSMLPASGPPVAHTRHASMTGSRSPLPNDWKPPSQTVANVPSHVDNTFRPRSSTLIGGNAAWNRTSREGGTREEAFLECMFGVTSAAKSASTTKMHVLPGKSKQAANPGMPARNTAEVVDQQPRRGNLQRSRTSTTLARSQHPSTSTTSDGDAYNQDSVLITRLFNVPLSETVATSPRATSEVAPPALNSVNDSSMTTTSSMDDIPQQKKPKLVERKVPAFAIGLIINLPRAGEISQSSTLSRPSSRSANATSFSSTSSSFGSDMQSSWTFLNAIPESLASSVSGTSSAPPGSPNPQNDELDRRIDTIVNNEDVILRAISLLEIESSRILHDQLQKILDNGVALGPKMPKPKSMQRINQRIISITDPSVISQTKSLRAAAKQMIWRVIYALRIPRVLTGLGFGAGHWSDEARAAHRICGRRQQNFFFFTLLTAFLGQHTQWLRRLAPESYRKHSGQSNRDDAHSHTLSHRTIIIADQRAIARRLVFLLASFLPSSSGMDGLYKPTEDVPGLQFSVSSPTSQVARSGSLRRAANRRMREHRLNSSVVDRGLLSSSADSGESTTPLERPQRFLPRRDSDVLSIKGLPIVSMAEDEIHRVPGAGTLSALTTRPSTPVAVFSARREPESDDYFAPFADHGDSLATAGLTNILRRNSSSLGNSSTVSSRWGSLVSGLSDIWSNKPDPSVDSGTTTAQSSATDSAGNRSADLQSRQRKVNALQEMVDQLEITKSSLMKSLQAQRNQTEHNTPDVIASLPRPVATTPRLRVDDRDGVVDVDLDIPGFANFDPTEMFRSPVKMSTPSMTSSNRDMTESIKSLRSIPGPMVNTNTVLENNVAGYLKKHHEDFSLHAVRPYAELEEDLRRTMVAEASTSKIFDGRNIESDEPRPTTFTTVVADMRNYSVRKITLEIKPHSGADSKEHDKAVDAIDGERTLAVSESSMSKAFVEEEIKDFDTGLADAIEKVLDLGDLSQAPPLMSPRFSHSRTTSSGTIKMTPPGAVGLGISSYPVVAKEYIRQDCRQAVMGALEDLVKDVCRDLDKVERGRDIHDSRRSDAATMKQDMKQDNMLRESVRCWLLDRRAASNLVTHYSTDKDSHWLVGSEYDVMTNDHRVVL